MLHDAKKMANALNDAEEYPVRDWDALKIPKKHGIYMFSEGGRRLSIGSATGSSGIRGRLHTQVYPTRIHPKEGPWTVENPPPKSVRDARNLLFHVLVEDNNGHAPKPARESPWWPKKEDIGTLNKAFERIHKMTVRWVAAPQDNPDPKNTAIRAEHCAICLLQPKYVAK